MKITDKQLTAFKSLYEKQVGRPVSREKAMSEAVDLLNLVKTIYTSIPPKDLYDISQEILEEI